MLKRQCAGGNSALPCEASPLLSPAVLTLVSCVLRYVQWCHGAPSLIPVLTKAYELLDDSTPQTAEAKEQFLVAAKKAADVVWERGLLIKVDMLLLDALSCNGSFATSNRHQTLSQCDQVEGTPGI